MNTSVNTTGGSDQHYNYFINALYGTPDEYRTYARLFASNDAENTGELQGAAAFTIFKDCGLPSSDLRTIWALCVPKPKTTMNFHAFLTMMKLVSARQHQQPLVIESASNSFPYPNLGGFSLLGYQQAFEQQSYPQPQPQTQVQTQTQTKVQPLQAPQQQHHQQQPVYGYPSSTAPDQFGLAPMNTLSPAYYSSSQPSAEYSNRSSLSPPVNVPLPTAPGLNGSFPTTSPTSALPQPPVSGYNYYPQNITQGQSSLDLALTEKEVQKCFKAFLAADLNGDGVIRGMEQQYISKAKISATDVNRIIKLCDLDQDGDLNPPEFFLAIALALRCQSEGISPPSVLSPALVNSAYYAASLKFPIPSQSAAPSQPRPQSEPQSLSYSSPMSQYSNFNGATDTPLSRLSQSTTQAQAQTQLHSQQMRSPDSTSHQSSANVPVRMGLDYSSPSMTRPESIDTHHGNLNSSHNFAPFSTSISTPLSTSSPTPANAQILASFPTPELEVAEVNPQSQYIAMLAEALRALSDAGEKDEEAARAVVVECASLATQDKDRLASISQADSRARAARANLLSYRAALSEAQMKAEDQERHRVRAEEQAEQEEAQLLAETGAVTISSPDGEVEEPPALRGLRETLETETAATHRAQERLLTAKSARDRLLQQEGALTSRISELRAEAATIETEFAEIEKTAGTLTHTVEKLKRDTADVEMDLAAAENLRRDATHRVMVLETEVIALGQRIEAAGIEREHAETELAGLLARECLLIAQRDAMVEKIAVLDADLVREAEQLRVKREEVLSLGRESAWQQEQLRIREEEEREQAEARAQVAEDITNAHAVAARATLAAQSKAEEAGTKSTKNEKEGVDTDAIDIDDVFRMDDDELDNVVNAEWELPDVEVPDLFSPFVNGETLLTGGHASRGDPSDTIDEDISFRDELPLGVEVNIGSVTVVSVDSMMNGDDVAFAHEFELPQSPPGLLALEKMDPTVSPMMSVGDNMNDTLNITQEEKKNTEPVRPSIDHDDPFADMALGFGFDQEEDGFAGADPFADPFTDLFADPFAPEQEEKANEATEVEPSSTRSPLSISADIVSGHQEQGKDQEQEQEQKTKTVDDTNPHDVVNVNVETNSIDGEAGNDEDGLEVEDMKLNPIGLSVDFDAGFEAGFDDDYPFAASLDDDLKELQNGVEAESELKQEQTKAFSAENIDADEFEFIPPPPEDDENENEKASAAVLPVSNSVVDDEDPFGDDASVDFDAAFDASFDAKDEKDENHKNHEKDEKETDLKSVPLASGSSSETDKHQISPELCVEEEKTIEENRNLGEEIGKVPVTTNLATPGSQKTTKTETQSRTKEASASVDAVQDDFDPFAGADDAVDDFPADMAIAEDAWAVNFDF